MRLDRYIQIKELGLNREDLKFQLEDLNSEIVEKIIGKENYKEYITKKIIDDKISIDEINDLRFKMGVIEGLKVDTNTTVYDLLDGIINQRILLPNYVKGWEKEDIFKELDSILERVNFRVDKILERINKNGDFHISLGNVDEIENELNGGDGFDQPGGFIEFRSFEIGGIFGRIYMGEKKEMDGRYVVQIPIKLKNGSKKQKIGEKEELDKNIEANKVDEVIKKYFPVKKGKERIPKIKKGVENKFKGFILSLEKNANRSLEYGRDDNSNYYVLSIMHDEIKALNDEKYSTKEIVSYLESYFEITNLLINDVIKASGIEHKKRFLTFSNMYFYNKTEDENDIGVSKETLKKFSKILLKEKTVKLSDVGGQEKAKKELEDIVKAIKNEEVIKSWGAKITSGIVFEGPPGTGKTLLAKALAGEVDGDVYVVKLTDIASSAYINEGADNLKELFKLFRYKAGKTKKKIIVVLDELDALFKKRGGKKSSGEDTKIVNTFLTEMGGLDDLSNILFIGTTNFIEDLDPAVIRSGRISTTIRVDLPDEIGRKQIFEIHIKKAKEKPKVEEAFNGMNLDRIVFKSDKLSGADIEEVVRKVIFEKAMEEIDTKNVSKINNEDFFKAIDEVKNKSKNTEKIMGFKPLTK